jgi:superfamily II DNA helicase RecQ
MHFFAVPALDPGDVQAELNQFIGSHRVVGIERQFVQAGAGSHWAVCVSVAPGLAPLPAALKADGSRAGKVDYKQVLSEAEFAVYVELRNLRKQLADEGGVPVYAVFSNEQLAAMVQQRVQTAEALAAIDGVGAARVQRYGAAFLERLGAAWAGPPA